MNLQPSKPGVRLALIALCTFAITAGQANHLMAAPGSTPISDVYDGIFNPIAIEIGWFSGTSGGFTETSTYTVPVSKRLEITEISCEAYAPSSTGVMMKLTATSGGTTVTHYLLGFSTTTAAPNYWLMSMTSLHLYVDPGSTITVDVVRQTPPGTDTGYYSDVVIAGRMTSL
jgi:hypothetical protein